MNTEEVTLEPTPPLKRIYTPPSIKLVFPINQCKSSFRRFTANSIKTYTSQYNKNRIHNLSDHILAEDELSVLTKGLSFVPTPTKTFKQDTNRYWNKFKTRMLTQYIFFAIQNTYSNLTLQEKSALNNLKNNQSIVIKPCDKGGGICTMNTRGYLTKIHTHLQDRNTYKPLTYNPASAIVNDACTLTEYIHS